LETQMSSYFSESSTHLHLPIPTPKYVHSPRVQRTYKLG